MRREIEIELGVELAGNEREDATGRLLEGLLEIENVKRDKKEADSEFNARRDALEDSVLELAGLLREGRTLRQVACVEELNIETGKVQIHRLDTMEIVSERDATEEERQLDMLQGMADAEKEAADADENETAAGVLTADERGE